MIKRISVTMSKFFRSKVEEDREFCQSPLFSRAVLLPGEILRYAFDPIRENRPVDSKFPKAFYNNYSTNERLRDEFEKATRVSGNLMLLESEPEIWVELKLRFFKKGQRSPFFVFDISIDGEGGHVSGY